MTIPIAAPPSRPPAASGRIRVEDPGAPPGRGRARRPGKARAVALLVLLAGALAGSARGEVVELELASRVDVLDGQPFGEVGAYEKLTGTIRFALDPTSPVNEVVTDLDLAPRGPDGRVHAHGDLVVLQPKDPAARRGTALLEVSNRGGKASLGYFNRAAYARDPSEPEHFGDGLLMRLGLTVIWVGWQFDVPREEGRLRLHVPTATGEDGRAITGLVRADWTVDEWTATLPLGHRGHVPYEPVDPESDEHVLTWRPGRDAERTVVPRHAWRFAVDRDGKLVDDLGHVSPLAGFEAGRIYELVYRAKDPAVVGMGLAAIRDTMSWAKHDEACPFPVERGVALGISQTGRFLRHLLYEGFNTDESGRLVFDGMMIHTAGAGRGSFDHRFGQPSRDAHRYSAFFYPTDVFPFASRAQRDPVTGRGAGLLETLSRRRHVPRIFATNTGYEYWGRAASLLHTSLDGSADVALHENERIYHLRGGQHFVSGFPPRQRVPGSQGAGAWLGNPLDFLRTLRALLVAMLEWVEDGTAPPPSAHPRVDDATLVPLALLDPPDVPGLAWPDVVHTAYRADYGPRFWSEGIVDVQPPALGPTYATLVPQVDALGNERAGLPTVEALAPVATFLPWALRFGEAGGNGELRDFLGTIAPLPRSRDEAEVLGDERPDLVTLYGSREGYERTARTAAARLVGERLLLEEDVEPAIERALALWDWAVGL